MRGNPGKIVQFKIDGKKGIAYNKDQQVKGKLLVKMIDDDYMPILKDGKNVIRVVDPEGVTLIGFSD